MGVLKKMGYHLKLVKLSQVLDQGGKCNVIRSLKKKKLDLFFFKMNLSNKQNL